MGISSFSFGIGGREDSVYKNEGSDDLSGEASTGAEAVGELGGSTAEGIEVSLL